MKPEPTIARWRAELGIGFTRGPLPDGWRAWVAPKPLLPIDETVRSLIERGAVRENELHEACPYAYARRSVFYAGIWAKSIRDDFEQVRTPRVETLKEFKKLAPKLEERLQQAIDVLVQLRGRDDLADRELAITDGPVLDLENALVGAVLKLRAYEPRLTAAHASLSQHHGNVERIAFAQTMGACWSRLTGRSPSLSDAFEGFLAAGWSTLFPDGDEFSWASAIRTAAGRLKAE